MQNGELLKSTNPKPKEGEQTRAQSLVILRAFLSNDLAVLGKRLPASYSSYRKIRQHPTNALGRALYGAPIISAQWRVMCDEELAEDDDTLEIKDFVEDTVVKPYREDLIAGIIENRIDYGWSPWEQIFEMGKWNKKTYLLLRDLKSLLVDITEITIDPRSGRFRGFRQPQQFWADVPGSTGKDPVLISEQGTVNAGWVVVPVEKSFLVSFGVEGTDLYGYPLLENVRPVYQNWLDSNDGAERYDRKIAGANWVVKYPPGTTMVEGVATDNSAIAQGIIDTLCACGSVVVPSSVEAYIEELNQGTRGQGGWDVELKDHSAKQATFIDRLSYLDKLMIRGFITPERSILEGEFGTKAEAGVHASAAVCHRENEHRKITRQVNKQILDPLIAYNFGEDAVGSVYIEAAPLVDAARAFLEQVYTALLANPSSAIEVIERTDIEGVMDSLDIPTKEYDPAAMENQGGGAMTPAAAAQAQALYQQANGGAMPPGTPGGPPAPPKSDIQDAKDSADDPKKKDLKLNCGTGAGGFQPGNDCGKGGGGGSDSGGADDRPLLGTVPGDKSGITFKTGISYEKQKALHDEVMKRVRSPDGSMKFISDLGFKNTIVERFGSYTGLEPNYSITFQAANPQEARAVGSLVATFSGQNAYIMNHHAPAKPTDTDVNAGLRIGKKDGGEWTPKEATEFLGKVNPTNDPNGYNFTRSEDGKHLVFLNFGAPEKEWMGGLAKHLGNDYNAGSFSGRSDYVERSGYHQDLGGIGDTSSERGRSVFRSAVHDILRPTVQASIHQGGHFNVKQFIAGSGFSEPEAEIVRRGLADFKGNPNVEFSLTISLDCGTGAGGFQPGNTCAQGGGEGGTTTAAEGADLGKADEKTYPHWGGAVNAKGEPVDLGKVKEKYGSIPIKGPDPTDTGDTGMGQAHDALRSWTKEYLYPAEYKASRQHVMDWAEAKDSLYSKEVVDPTWDAIYKGTQDRLKEAGVETVSVFRGGYLPLDHPLAQAIMNGDLKDGHEFNYHGILAASFSTDRNIATTFARDRSLEKDGRIGFVIQQNVPRKDIIAADFASTGFIEGEHELIVKEGDSPSHRVKLAFSSLLLSPMEVDLAKGTVESFDLTETAFQRGIGKPSPMEFDCGTGAGGFQPGNTCATGGGGDSGGSTGGGRISKAEIKASAVPHPKTEAEFPMFVQRVKATPVYKEMTRRVDEKAKEVDTSKFTPEELRHGTTTLWSVDKNTTGTGIQGERVWTPERQAAHDKLVDQFVTEESKAPSGKRPQAVLMLGPPGSGKSTTGVPYVQKLLPGVKFSTLNSDDVKAKLPEYEGWNASLLHEESTNVVEKNMTTKAVYGRHNVIFDFTGANKDKVKTLIGDMSRNGYDVHLVNVEIPPQESGARAWDRFQQRAFNKKDPGRFVPPDLAFKVGTEPLTNYNELKLDPRVKSWVSIDNSRGEGQAKIVDRGKRAKPK